MIVRAMIAALLFGALTSACASFPPPPQQIAEPLIANGVLRSVDGALLGLSVWPATQPRAVVIGVHGMNDYGRSFEAAGLWWSQAAGITVYAYDQRGFGRSPNFGRWPGKGALKADLRAAIDAVRAQQPGLPIYLVGHSMGAGVVMAAAKEEPLDVAGVVLVSPSVWGGARLPIAYRLALNIAASATPGKTLTGERARRQASDNIPLLLMMLHDPFVIKQTRLDAVLGVVRIMGKGWDASNEIGGRALVLYGEKDEIIPIDAMRRAARRLCGDVDTVAYPDGWHMLLDDLQAENVWRDIARWIAANETGAAGQSGLGPAASVCLGAGS